MGTDFTALRISTAREALDLFFEPRPGHLGLPNPSSEASLVRSWLDDERRRSFAPLLSLARAGQDFFDLQAIASRLDWMARVHRERKPELNWYSFGGCDIKLFFVVARTMLDHIAVAISSYATRRGQVPSKSFKILIDFAEKEGAKAESKIGSDLFEILKNVWWFAEVRYLRDTLVHRGGRVFAADPVDGIPFGILRGEGEEFIEMGDWCRFNENCWDFRLYSAWLSAALFDLYYRVSLAILRRIDPHTQWKRDMSWIECDGLETTQRWLSRVVSRAA